MLICFSLFYLKIPILIIPYVIHENSMIKQHTSYSRNKLLTVHTTDKPKTWGLQLGYTEKFYP